MEELVSDEDVKLIVFTVAGGSLDVVAWGVKILAVFTADSHTCRLVLTEKLALQIIRWVARWLPEVSVEVSSLIRCKSLNHQEQWCNMWMEGTRLLFLQIVLPASRHPLGETLSNLPLSLLSSLGTRTVTSKIL